MPSDFEFAPSDPDSFQTRKRSSWNRDPRSFGPTSRHRFGERLRKIPECSVVESMTITPRDRRRPTPQIGRLVSLAAVPA